MDVGAVDMSIWLVLLGVKTLIVSGRASQRAGVSRSQQAGQGTVDFTLVMMGCGYPIANEI